MSQTLLSMHALFEEWLASRPGRGQRAGDGELSEASAQLYRDMWAVFCSHCGGLPKRARKSGHADILTTLNRADLQALLQEPVASKTKASNHEPAWSERYAWRMLHLIDRVLAFHAQRQGIPKNNCAHVLLQEAPYRHANASHLDAAPELLTDGDVERLIGHLRSSVGQGHNTAEHPASKARWKPARDAAVVAAMLGAGLAPGDVQVLQLNGLAIHEGPEPGIPWRLTVPADGLSPQHQSPLASWAGHLLAHWLTVREQMAVPGTYVFPSTLKGGGLSRMSCHRIAVNVLDAAGIPGGVPFRLRHTFAVRQLSLGHSEELVGRWLGLVESKAMRRYVAMATPIAGVS